MELRGEIRDISMLLEVFQIVNVGKKSGKLEVSGEDGKVIFYIKDGNIISVDTTVPNLRVLKEKTEKGEAKFTDSLISFLHYIYYWRNGRFQFKDENISVKERGKADMTNLIMELSKELDETPEAIKKLIFLDPQFTLSGDISSNQLTLEKKDFLVFQEFLRGKTLKQVLFAGTPYSELIATVRKLLSAGIISPVEKKESEAGKTVSVIPTVPEEKLEQVRERLVEALGPMGEFLVDETFEDLGISQLFVDSVDKFIETLIEKIPDGCIIDGEDCKERFRQEFREILS
ncbi:DUF4388 domain-containing protein [Desulfurobacterium crinifex]